MVRRRSADDTRPPLPRFRRGKGTAYVADVVERVRVLVEGTTLSQAVIAERVGLSASTVHLWKVRRGWRRPAGVPCAVRKVSLDRASFTRRHRDALRRLEALAEGAADRLAGAQHADERARALALAARAKAMRLPARSEREPTP